jgi:hypothetical protein
MAGLVYELKHLDRGQSGPHVAVRAAQAKYDIEANKRGFVRMCMPY